MRARFGPSTITAEDRLALEVDTVEDFAPSAFVRYTFSDGGWWALRASGTEPKLKFYSEHFVASPDHSAKALGDALAVLNARVDMMLRHVAHLDRFGLLDYQAPI